MDSSITIQPQYIFGLKAETKGSVFHIDEQRLVYAVGHYVVVYNNDDRQMQCFPALEGSSAITAMTLCPKKRYLAVAEKAERGIIFVYDLEKNKKKKPLVTSDCLSQEYISLCFAPKQEKKFLVSLGGAPDWNLIFWQWDRQKILYVQQVSQGNPLSQVSFNSSDYMNGIIVTGQGVFCWLKIVDGQLKKQNTGISKKEVNVSNNYLCHSWLNDGKLVVGTDSGEVLLFDQNCDYRGYFLCGMENWKCVTIVPYSNGFLVGGQESRVVVFEKNPDDLRMHYVRSQKFLGITSEPEATIMGISMLPTSEESIVVTTSTNQIYSLSFTNEKEEPEPLSDSFHSNTITGLDICIRKPLAVTCGLDNTVRVWNYVERSLEVVKHFNEEPYAVAFHPSGFHIVVGFADKLRMMNVFQNTIKTYKEIHIKACREIRFSHGGHLFAATNGHMIQVFNFYTGENPPSMQFKGHTGKVSSIYWNEDDSCLYSAGWDGAVFQWDLYHRSERDKIPDYSRKGTKFSSIVAAREDKAEGQFLYISGNDKEIKEVSEGKCLRNLETRTMVGPMELMNSNKVLFAGLAEGEKPGAVRAYNFEPFDGEYIEYQAHSLPIEAVRVSFDDCYLITAGQDGCVIIFEIKDTKSFKREKESYGLPFAEEILITNSEVDELYKENEDLLATIKELEMNNETQYEMALSEKQSEIDKLQEQIKEAAQKEKEKYMSLLKFKEEAEQSYNDRILEIHEHFEQEKQKMKVAFQQKFDKEVQRYQKLSKEKELSAKEVAETIERMKSDHTKQMAENESYYNKQLQQVRKQIEALRIEHEYHKNEFDEKEKKYEETNETTLFQLREQNIKEIQSIEFECKKAEAEVNIAMKEKEKLKKQKDEKAEEVKKIDSDLEKQKDVIKQLNDELNTSSKEIKVRKKTIEEKDKRIHELKKKSQELEKFRFVLDYKIRELKRDIDPKEDEIARLKEQTHEMEKELKHLDSVNEKLGILVENLKLRQYGMQNEINNQKDKLSQNQARMQAIKDAIYEGVQYIKEEKKLKEAVLSMYEKFVRNEAQAKSANTEKEYVRQCNHLENTISKLREKLDKANLVQQQDQVRIMGQNVELVNGINGLKKEIKHLQYLKRQVKILETEKASKKASTEDHSKKEIEMQKEEIKTLKNRLAELERPTSQSMRSQEIY